MNIRELQPQKVCPDLSHKIEN